MAEIELKPCPFCGYDEGGCGAEGGMYHSVIEATEAWNRRVDNG